MARNYRIIQRDGRTVAYDPGRVVSSILDAIRSAGHGDETLADKIAPMVEFGLSHYYGATITVDDVAQCIEQSLRTLIDSPEIAEAYVSLRRQRQRLRELAHSSAARGEGPLVAGGAGNSLADWNRARIESALVRERDLALNDARSVADAVEQKILRAKVGHITTALIRALVDAELIERGLIAPGGGPSAYIVPAYDLQQAIFPMADQAEGRLCETPRALEHRVAAAVLRQHALSGVHSPEVARAHLSGSIDLSGVSHPARMASAGVHCGRALSVGAGLGFDAEFPESCADVDAAAQRLARLAWALCGASAGPVTLHRFDTALAGLGGVESPSAVTSLLDRLAAVGGAHAGEVGIRAGSPGMWLVFDALAGEAHLSGSLPLLRAVVGWLRESGGERGRSLGLLLRVGAATMDDRAGLVTLEQSIALAMGGHPVRWELARNDSAAGFGLFDAAEDSMPALSCVLAEASVNLFAPFPSVPDPDMAVSEDRAYGVIEGQIATAVRGLSERADFVRRFTLRRRESDPGFQTRLAARLLQHVVPCRVMIGGLAPTAAALAASEAASDVARSAQRLSSWLHFRLRDAAKRFGTPVALSGAPNWAASERFGGVGGSRAAESGAASWAHWQAQSVGFRLTSRSAGESRDETEARLAQESALHDMAVDSVSVLDPAREKLTMASVLSLLAVALGADAVGEVPRSALSLNALELSVSLKRCGECGASSPADASSCRSCGASSFRAMPSEAQLFDNLGV